MGTKTMVGKEISKNLRALRTIKPETAWRQELKSELFHAGDSQETLVSRGFSSFDLSFEPRRLAPILIPLAVVCFVLFGAVVPLGTGPEEIAERVNYFVLLETKLDQISTPEDIQDLVNIFEQASNSIGEAAKNPGETAEVAKAVANINKKVEQIEKDFGEQASDLKDSAQVLTARTAEALGQDIEDAQKELVANLIASYQSSTLSNPQLELLNLAQEYYNNGQLELALETILRIGE